MAKSKKTGREYQSRFERGVRTGKPPPGFNRFGSPIHCGIREVPGGAECSAKAVDMGRCDYHSDQYLEQTPRDREQDQLGEGG